MAAEHHAIKPWCTAYDDGTYFNFMNSQSHPLSTVSKASLAAAAGERRGGGGGGRRGANLCIFMDLVVAECSYITYWLYHGLLETLS